MVLNMAYNQMFGHDKIWQDEALSDNLYEQRGNPDTRTIRMGQATPNTGLFRSEWKWVFEGVKTCNVFMNFVDEVPGMDPERLAGMKAQIRFIRAFLYFRLANFYGDHSLLPAGYFARRVAPRLPHSLSGGDECAAP